MGNVHPTTVQASFRKSLLPSFTKDLGELLA